MTVQCLPTTDHLPQPLQRIMDRLTDEQKLLLILKRDLYNGQWAPMIEDLTNRLAGRPYVLKLGNRMTEDLARIEQIQAIEQHYQVDLTDYLAALSLTESTL